MKKFETPDCKHPKKDDAIITCAANIPSVYFGMIYFINNGITIIIDPKKRGAMCAEMSNGFEIYFLISSMLSDSPYLSVNRGKIVAYTDEYNLSIRVLIIAAMP